MTGHKYQSLMRITATEFKAKCLALIDEVHEGAEPIVITKHGKVVAHLVGVTVDDPLAMARKELAGSVLDYVDPFGPAVKEAEIEAEN